MTCLPGSDNLTKGINRAHQIQIQGELIRATCWGKKKASQFAVPTNLVKIWA